MPEASIEPRRRSVVERFCEDSSFWPLTMFAEKLDRGFSTGFSTFIIRCFLGFFNRAIVSLFYRLKIICFFVKFPLGTIVTVFLVTYKWQVLWSSPFTDMTKVLKE